MKLETWTATLAPAKQKQVTYSQTWSRLTLSYLTLGVAVHPASPYAKISTCYADNIMIDSKYKSRQRIHISRMKCASSVQLFLIPQSLKSNLRQMISLFRWYGNMKPAEGKLWRKLMINCITSCRRHQSVSRNMMKIMSAPMRKCKSINP